MDEEIREYEKYLASFGVVEKPKMPKFNVSAYTDNEYLSVVYGLLNDYDKLDEEYLTINYLKGD